MSISSETVRLAQNGDLLAFEQIMSEFEKPLWNYLVKLAGNQEDAEDIMQETFVKIYKNVKKIDPLKNIKSWIYTIATNTAYDCLRKRKRDGLVKFDDEYETNPENIGYYPVAIQESMDIKDVSAAINNLNILYRTPVLLYYKDGFSYIEIADMLSIPVNTLKTRLARAKKYLATSLINYQ